MNHGSPGVVLLNMGGPPRLQDVRPFLYNLFRDPMLFRFPLGSLFQTPFALLVSTIRARSARGRYRVIGGGSPLVQITQRQANALEKDLHSRGYSFPVSIAMRYWKPDTREAVEKVLEKNVDRIIGLPMYPQYSKATTGSSLDLIDTVLRELRSGLGLRTIKSWWSHPGYLACMARRIRKALDQTGPGPNTGILFLAHSLPQRFVEEGDPYVSEVQGTVQGIISIIKEECAGTTIPWYLAYQSRFGPVRWVGPTVEEVLRQMVAKGLCRIVAVPVSFVSDHLETLYDIDILYQRLARQFGVSVFVRTETLNDAPDFIQCLTDLIVEEGPEEYLNN